MSKSVRYRSNGNAEGSPSVRIVEALAMARGDDSTNVESLYGQFDLEAIDQLVANSRGEFRIELVVGGYHVDVRGDGSVSVD